MYVPANQGGGYTPPIPGTDVALAQGKTFLGNAQGRAAEATPPTGVPAGGTIAQVLSSNAGTPTWRDQLQADLYGDGSDGIVVIDPGLGALELDKPVNNFMSLTIGAGTFLDAPKWSVNGLCPIIIIRSRTAIVLNGKIRANGVAGYFVDGGGPPGAVRGFVDNCGDNDITPEGMPPSLGGPFDEAEPRILTIPGGWGDGTDWFSAKLAARGWPLQVDDIIQDSPEPFVGDGWQDFVGPGPGRLWRFAAGGGGGAGKWNDGEDDQYVKGGQGGGILIVQAPGIIFGAAGAIEARGTPLDWTTWNDDEHAMPMPGGGGGGYVEVWTETALSMGDKAKVLVNGGYSYKGVAPAPLIEGNRGFDGIKRFMLLR